MPSRTKVDRLVVNLHWTTDNVNSLVDMPTSATSLVISKDAKAIVPSGIAPVQHPGRSWSKREMADHSWDQSRTNAVTPMTFLFLEKQVSSTRHSLSNSQGIGSGGSSSCLYVTRTGQAVTLINLSFFEPETTFKCIMNEIFLLLNLPELDVLFKDQDGKLKKEWIFVVDNGPAEQPNCSLVQFCLVRLLKFLNLEKIKQVGIS